MTLLSDVRRNTERAGKIYQEMGQMAQDSQIKEALEARAFVSEKTLEKLLVFFLLFLDHVLFQTSSLRGCVGGRVQ